MAKTISELSDEIFGIKLEIKSLNDEIDALKERQEQLEGELVTAAEAQGLERGGGKTSTFKVEPHTVPQVVDWDAVYKYIAKHKFYHLLQRRLSTTAFTELWEQGENVPGTEKFTKTRVTVKGAN